MRAWPRRQTTRAVLALLLAGCAAGGGGGSATGLAGGSVGCSDGPRPTLDCRGVLSQFARDFRADLNALARVQVGAATVTTRLIEADALSADIIQHHYQTCSMYNACIISREQFAARMERLHGLQLEVRRAVGVSPVTAIAGQQHIQINPNVSVGSTPLPGGASPPSADSPSADQPPVAPDGTVSTPPTEPLPAGSSAAGQVAPPDRLDAVLGVLREGASVFRSPAAPPAPSPGADGPDLDARLGAMVAALRHEVARRRPAAASGTAVVGHFTQEGQTYAGPLGAILQERVAAIVHHQKAFGASARTRGVTIKDVSGVGAPNSPAALGAIYGADIAITGTYRRDADQIVVRVSALGADGTELARVSETLPAGVLPAPLAEGPSNAVDTERLLRALERLGPRASGDARVEVTTHRPGEGATFHLGEQIRYLVTATTGGHLYLFHVDAERNVAQLFPNAYQRDARIDAGAALEIPPPGADFTLEAAPPFGLETTVAIVTPRPLDARARADLVTALGRPTPEAMTATRGIIVTPASAGAGAAPPVWNTVTVLVRP